jgi:DNA modification methylase
MIEVFHEVRRVLRNDGTLWLNIGDSYNAMQGKGFKPGGGKNIAAAPIIKRPTPTGLKPKDLVGIPWMLAFALRADGWLLRSDIIWSKPNPMPESVTDRPTKSHEYVFLLTKAATYYWDAEAVKEEATGESRNRATFRGGGRCVNNNSFDNSGDFQPEDTGQGGEMATTRNLRSVWTIATQPFKGAHFATFPQKLAEICIKAGSKENDVILDPFSGAGTTGLVALRLNRDAILIELNPAYNEMARERCAEIQPQLIGVSK